MSKLTTNGSKPGRVLPAPGPRPQVSEFALERADHAAPPRADRALPRILVIDDEQELVTLLELGLSRAGFHVRGARDGSEGLTLARRWLPNLIILDLMMPGLDGLQVCRMLREQRPTANIPVIILTAANDLEHKLVSFDIGANDYLSKPFDMAELIARINVHLAARRNLRGLPYRRAGQVFTVFSLRGGVGKTSIAVNLAMALSSKRKPRLTERVALIDMAFSSGLVGMMLNLSGKLDWGKLAREERDGLNQLVLQQYFCPSDHAQVHSLLAPAQPQDIERIDADLVNTVISFSRQHFPFTVIDTPAAFDDTTLAALDASDLIILVLTPDVAGVGLAAKAMSVFKALGYAEQRVRLVSNRPYDAPSIEVKHIEKTLGQELDVSIPYENSTYLAAINLGRPFLACYPRRPAAQELRRLAARVRKMRAFANGGPPAPEHGNGRHPVISRMWGRVKNRAR